jgi:hypothetical protein
VVVFGIFHLTVHAVGRVVRVRALLQDEEWPPPAGSAAELKDAARRLGKGKGRNGGTGSDGGSDGGRGGDDEEDGGDEYEDENGSEEER